MTNTDTQAVDVQSVTEEMTAAWVAYEPPAQIEPMNLARWLGQVRCAFMAGYRAAHPATFHETGESLKVEKDGERGVFIPRELYDFLMGTGEIDGTSFGDRNDGLPGRFWWRALLMTAALSPPLDREAIRAEAFEEAAALVANNWVHKNPANSEVVPLTDLADRVRKLGALSPDTDPIPVEKPTQPQ